jgi:Doubled CXXCH motif (Paired_CXXCH_1)
MLALSIASFAAADPLLGPHNLNGVKGCTSCHSPHNGSLDNGGTAATGATYLWAQKVNGATFATFGGGTLVNGAPAETDPQAHSVLCMSCHDNGVSGTTMSAMSQLGENLSTTHPVDVKYTSNTATSYDWAITIAAGRVSFNNASFVGGHPARLYVDAAGTNAYVECSTCHNPHAWQNAVVKIANVNTAKVTDKFVRGWYDPTDGASQANFCRSCHFSKSMDYQTGAGTQPI